MSNCIFKTILIIVVLSTAIVSVDVFLVEDYFRCFILFVMLVLFVFISALYIKRIGYFTPSYFFLVDIGFFVYVLSPFYFTEEKLMNKGMENLQVLWPGDYFYLYCIIIGMFYFFVILYLLSIDRKIFNTEQIFAFNKKEEIFLILINLFVCVPLIYFIGDSYLFACAPIFTYFSVRIFMGIEKKKFSIISFLGILSCFIGMVSFIKMRFILIQYILPILFCLAICLQIKYKKYNLIKFLKRLSFVVILIVLYGILSEIIKLNDLNTTKVYSFDLSDSELMIWFVERQIYRVFGIWTHLSGNIIEYVDKNNFFYGITYIKNWSNLFDFEYVSLPEISARFILASYAQPGLIGDGYANFGILGSVSNLIISFLLMEFLFRKFISSKNNENRIYLLIVATVPFTTLLLDGGTINSVIFNLFLCFFSFFIRVIKSVKMFKQREVLK